MHVTCFFHILVLIYMFGWRSASEQMAARELIQVTQFVHLLILFHALYIDSSINSWSQSQVINKWNLHRFSVKQNQHLSVNCRVTSATTSLKSAIQCLKLCCGQHLIPVNPNQLFFWYIIVIIIVFKSIIIPCMHRLDCLCSDRSPLCTILGNLSSESFYM